MLIACGANDVLAPPPAADYSRFDLLQVDGARIDCAAQDGHRLELSNENCYVGLCRGTFESASFGAGSYSGLLPRRARDPNNPGRFLPADRPLVLTLVEQDVIGTLELQDDSAEAMWRPVSGPATAMVCAVRQP